MEQDNRTSRVLSEEEKRSFEGITIDESTQQETTDLGYQDDTQQTYENIFQERVKVYTFHSMSWKMKLLIAIVVAILAVAIVFIGGFVLLIFLGLAILGACISFLRRLL